MLTDDNITALRMERQFLSCKANEEEYIKLYRDMQPGQNVYWNGFGDPPTITFRADFDDLEFNRQRQKERKLIKGRFQGGNIGWIMPEDLELFAALALKPLDSMTGIQKTLIHLLQHEGPMNIGLMKEMTSLLVKEITPALHRLQEAFLIYEDQYDGEWDRSWYLFSEIFPNVNLHKYTRNEALKIILKRFAYRNVLINEDMIKSFYKITNKDIKKALTELVQDNIFVPYENYYVLKSDFDLLKKTSFQIDKSVYVLHKNDFLVKSNEYWLKDKYKQTGRDILQYILIDGKFHGVVAGKFKNGPYIIEDIVLDLSEDDKQKRKDEIIEAVYQVNNRKLSPIKQYCGSLL